MIWIKVKSMSGTFVHINVAHITTFFYAKDKDATLINLDSEDLWDDRNVAVEGDITKELARTIGMSTGCTLYHITGEK